MLVNGLLLRFYLFNIILQIQINTNIIYPHDRLKVTNQLFGLRVMWL